MSPEIIAAVISAVFGIIMWLLKNKDDAQGKEIDAMRGSVNLLFKKHDDDAAALADLKVQIASKHYERPELDAKFDRLDQTFKEGFRDLGSKFDRLSDALTKHITKEDARG